jgi:hypothetical protein
MDLKIMLTHMPHIFLKEKIKTEKNKKESRTKRRACQGCQGF